MRRKRKILVSSQNYGLSRLKGETKLHVQIATYLRSRDMLFHHSPNEGKRSHFQQWLIKKMGVSSGFPDFVIYDSGRLVLLDYYLEVKHGNNKPTPNQLRWLKALTEGDKFACVVWSEWAARKAVEEASNFLSGFSVSGEWCLVDDTYYVHIFDELPTAIRKKIKE